MTTIRKLVAELGFDVDEKTLRKWDAAVEATKKSMAAAEKQAKGGFSAALRKLDIDTKKLSDTLRDKLKGGLESVNSAMTSMAKWGIIGLTGALTGLGVMAARTSSEFESLRAALKTVTGSEQNATQAFDFIRRFAKDTPFQVQEVAQAFIKLKALGLDPSEAALRSYGNTASAMGKSLKDVYEAVADAITGEFERLKEFGIKASSDGDRVAMTFQGITTEIGKNAQEIEAYIRRIGAETFAGAMADQMKTFGGIMSNLRDTFDSFLLGVGQAGLLPALKEVGLEMASMLSGSGDLAQSLGEALGDAVRKLWSEFKRLIPDLLTFVESLPHLISGVAKFVGVVVDLVKAMGGPTGLVQLFISLKLAMAALQLSASSAAIGLSGLGGAFAGLGIAVAGAGAIIATTTAKLNELQQKSRQLADDVLAGWQRVEQEMEYGDLVNRREKLRHELAQAEAREAAVRQDIYGERTALEATGEWLTGYDDYRKAQRDKRAIGWDNVVSDAEEDTRRVRAQLEQVDTEFSRRGEAGRQAIIAGADIVSAGAASVMAPHGAAEIARLEQQGIGEKLKVVRALEQKRRRGGLTPSEKAFLTKSRKELDLVTPKGSGRGGVSLRRAEASGVAEQLRELARDRESPEAAEEAIKAAARVLNRGGTQEVALQAGRSALDRLTKTKRTGKDRSVDDILQDFGAGRTRGAAGPGGVRPTLGTTINRVTNEYRPEIHNEFKVVQNDGESSTSFAVRVKDMVKDEMDTVFRQGFDRFVGAVG